MGGKDGCLHGASLAGARYQSGKFEETFIITTCLFSAETVSGGDALIYGQYT